MSTELEIIKPEITELPITPIPRAEPETGYYRIKKDNEDKWYQECGFLEGQLTYVYAGKDAYHVFIGEREWKYKYEEQEDFDEYFEFVPDGASIRQKQVTDLMSEIAATDLGMIETRKQISGFSPHVDNGELATSSQLVPVGTDMQTTKRAVAEIRNTTMKVKKELEVKTRRLELMIKEQSRALAIKAKEMAEMVEKMEEAIWTINLYLGKNEEIHILRKGQPAPAEEKITIRQGVLYMDEECAIAAREGGIDIRNVEQFDEWILENENNLKRVLPERKGIISLHIKREGKDYGDPWVTSQTNVANLHWTYFLIRNGENVYRVYVDMNVGSILFPGSDEFEELFWSYETAWDEPGRPTIKKPLKPGSEAYMKAMDRAEARRKHYLRVGLVLQGLMDRTPIFKPMPTDRINLCDPRHCEEWLNLIYEKEKVITDGRPLFREWQRTANTKLEVGHRIIGIFDYSSRLRGDEKNYEPCRIYPSSASYPKSCQLHTIEEREGDKYIIRYERKGETVYRRDAWMSNKDRIGEPEVRARCWLMKDDGFILNFDEVTVEEMEYYVDHRLSRHSYKDMVPLLTEAIRLKKAEVEEEAPFRMLLAGQIVKRYSVSFEEAGERLDELVKWWKFKNRTHRALISEDAKAVTMIVDEFGLRRKQESIREKVDGIKDVIISVIAGQEPAPVLIAHKSDNKYVAYVPHNGQNVWVTEQLWTHNRVSGAITIKEAKQWKLVDKRHERWEILYKHERWADWRILPAMSDVLTDPELAALVEAATEKLASRIVRKKEDHLAKADSTWPGEAEKAEKAGYLRFLPLCFYHNDDFELTFWFSDVEPIIPTENVITNRSELPAIARVGVNWKRTAKDGVVMEKYFSDEHHYSYSPESPPWFTDYAGHKVESIIVKRWDDNIELVAKEFELVRKHKDVVDELSKMYDYIPSLVAEKMYAIKVAAARKEFDAEYGDPELWEDHLKSLKISHHSPAYLDGILDWFAERNINPIGWTLGQVYEKAHALGYFEAGRDWAGRREEKKVPDDIPMDFVIPLPVKESEVNE